MTMSPGRLSVLLVVVALVACAAKPDVPLHTTEASATCARTKSTDCVGTPPSYAQDVAPVIARRCFSCHANGGIAADDHDFSRFATLHAQKSSVLAQVGACAMPPAQAQATLQPEEADLILRWAACGAPQN